MNEHKSKRQRTTDRILEAATVLFLDKGFAGTSIGSIEAAAGLAPRTGGFYRHFASKSELLVAIAAKTIENPEEMGLTDMLPLGDTRAELILIARGYAHAFERRERLGALVAEVQNMPEITQLVAQVDADLRRQIQQFIASKPAAHGLSIAEVTSLTFMVFGGWVFFLQKQEGGKGSRALTDQKMLDMWASFWANTLDKPVSPD